MTTQLLVGRERELGVIEDALSNVGVRGGGLVVRGEPGIGKSTVLDAASRSAGERGVRVLRTAGAPSESHLPFAGLHALLRPVLDGVDALPDRQRHAVLAAFGMAPMQPPDLFLIALGALNLLSDAASHAPLLLEIEDAHWLDHPTGEVLAFIARRLESEPIVLLAAVRDGPGTPLEAAGLPELRLEGLDAGAARALLDAHAPDLPAGVRDRLLEEAAGNPLALVELPLALEELGLGTDPPAWPPLTERLERAFAAQASALPEPARTVLLVAALDDGTVLSEVLGAASRVVGHVIDEEALTPAVLAGLVEVDDVRLRFRHPLVRSAIRQAATVADRHAAHGALAAALAATPDRAIWHQAAAALGPDEAIAAGLERSARNARQHGSIGPAVDALERAAQLSPDPGVRGARLLSAAELAFDLGRQDDVVRLLRAAEPLELPAGERARLAWLRELYAARLWSGTARMATLVRIAERMHLEGDTDRALSSLRALALRCWWSYPDAAADDLVVAVTERMPIPPDRPERIAILSFAAPVTHGPEVIEELERAARRGVLDPEMAFHLGDASTAVGAYGVSGALLATAVEGLRAQGRLGVLAQVLVSQAWTGFHLGSWDVGLAAAEEAELLAGETGQPRYAAAAQLARATLGALRGRDDAEALADAAEQTLLPMGASPLLGLVQLTRGVAALGDGRSGDAYEQLRRLFDPGDIAHHRYLRWWALADFVDAAVHSGHHGEAHAVTEQLRPIAARSGSPLLGVAMSYALTLLAPDADADARFRAALSRPDLATWPLIRARVLLGYGAWLRRRHRVAESRAPIRAARQAFDALGAGPWSDRARRELRASGETSRGRSPGAWDQLTAQEIQIAQMAAEGLTNREIGQRLYLSHRTIGSHLYRIFPKLGITSRSELRAALRDAV